jgi:hypothetical protein
VVAHQIIPSKFKTVPQAPTAIRITDNVPLIAGSRVRNDVPLPHGCCAAFIGICPKHLQARRSSERDSTIYQCIQQVQNLRSVMRALLDGRAFEGAQSR